MGGGLAEAELAAAVSGAGGLGTVGILPDPDKFAQELRRARSMTDGKPLAANLLLPFARSAHVEACLAAGVDAVVMFCGSDPDGVRRLREGGVLVLAQVGTEAGARQALAEGVDGLVAQGLEAGGPPLPPEPPARFLPPGLERAPGRPRVSGAGVPVPEGAR